MEALHEWSIIDKASGDHELDLQIGFASWLSKLRPDELQEAEPLLDFSNGICIGMCELAWYLRISVGTLSGRTGGSEDLSFAVHRVRRKASSEDYREEECILQSQNPLEPLTSCHIDPFAPLVQPHADPKLRSEICCKSFVCMEKIEAADSFEEVLDAMYEFSTWYMLSTEEMESDQVIKLDPFREMDTLLNEAARYLKVQAEDASGMCRTAREAQQIVSEAAAKMLKECCSQSGIVMLAKDQNNAAGIESETELRWAARYRRSKAVRKGFVLQWCRVEPSPEKSSCIDCEVDLGSLVFEDADAEAAVGAGIELNKPLLIRIDVLSESISVGQKGNDGHFQCESVDGSNDGNSFPTNVGTTILLPHLVRQHIPFSSAPPLPSSPNVFVAMLHKVVSYLSHLGSICVICTETTLHPRVGPHLPCPCSQPLCEATFDRWFNPSSPSISSA